MVLARTDSRRLPWKHHRRWDTTTMLEALLRRVTQAALPVVVVTTARPRDRGLQVLARKAGCTGVARYRGDVNDVLGRVIDAALHLGWDYIVRISGDSPLVDPRVVRWAVARWHRRCPDVWSNVWPRRCLPPGLSVEVVRVAALQRLHAHGNPNAAEREHLTLGLYHRATTFVIESCADTPLAHHRCRRHGLRAQRSGCCVDTLADWIRLRPVGA